MKSTQIGRKSLVKLSLIFLLISLTVFFIFLFISIKAESSVSITVSDPVIKGSLWSRKVVFSSDSSDHVYDAEVSVDIPENLGNVELYRFITSDTKIRVTDDPEYNF